MKLVFGADHDVALFASRGLGVNINPPFTAIGIANDYGVLVGAIVYNNCVYYGDKVSNIEITVFAPGCATRGIIRAALHYPFVQLCALRVTCRTKRSNKLVCRILPRLGFKFEATLHNYFGPLKGDDAILYRMTRAQASKWLKEIE